MLKVLPRVPNKLVGSVVIVSYSALAALGYFFIATI